MRKLLDTHVDFIVVMEATGVYHQGVAHYLYQHGYAVCIRQSGRVKRYAQSLDQRSKTDALDSRMLSMHGLERDLRLWHPPGKCLQELKALSRERSALLKDRTVEKNRQDAKESCHHSNPKATKRHLARLKLINVQLASIEAEMRELVLKDPEVKSKLGFLQSIPRGFIYICSNGRWGDPGF
ncbi:MAG: transposase [Muriicola sp.]